MNMLSVQTRGEAEIPLTEEILFATTETFGIHLLVARSESGVCAVITDASPRQLVHMLASAFPRHLRREDAASLRKDLQQVLDFLNFQPSSGARSILGACLSMRCRQPSVPTGRKLRHSP
ncbi:MULTISPECIES: hypothetical protein [unclassified Variovorax]|jgi:hypothetical protein|uniref:hypothetical protein n=1 Tax=unclassified Variovorax TaxID=663243 RepID=UPI000F9221D0|nr:MULTISPECIES: hypothetical protein [unclassified Variovorax]RSZ40561.1 hypothetical protein EJO71_16950 [Variovorax sp. 679]